MATKYDWPAEEDRRLIGKSISRLDGADKVTGKATYAYDRNLPGMLVAQVLTSPYAHARIVKIDTTSAEKIKGVRGIEMINGQNAELQWNGQEILALAADTEEIARDGIEAIEVDYEVLPHLVKEEDIDQAGSRVKPAADKTEGDPDSAFSSADVVHEGYYGLPTITHCCLEPHGQVVDWTGDEVIVYASTQAVSRIGADLAKNLARDENFAEIKPSQVRIITPVMGGGFGSKFAIDSWGVACAKLSKKTGHPVKLMLDRDAELQIAGGRPSDYGKIKVAAKKDGTLTAYQSETWSTGGLTSRGAPPLPYVMAPENQQIRHLSVATNTGPARAWRAPNHPQAAVLTWPAYTDLAAKLDMDPLDLVLKNLELTARPEVYRKELKIAADMIGWRNKFHRPGDRQRGPVKRGVGLSMHTWGGRPHDSNCQVSIHPDGTAVAALGTQDLGSGTRTVVAIVLAETMGLPLEAVEVQMGDSILLPSGASGGSTTVGGVSSSTRRAAVNALEELKREIAPVLNADPDEIVAKDGYLEISGTDKRISWHRACKKLGARTLTGIGKQPDRRGGKLADSGVGGVQMADVSVDVETGLVTMNKMVAVQDCGLIIDLKTAKSQVYGSLIMGICWALWEERVYDQSSGLYLNADMEFYKLAGLGDIGQLEVHMITGDYDERGVIGLGEPPAISPGAAISNAVHNAIGVRVPTLPLTPDRVLEALEKGGKA
jgi:xanthine dehydrogenase YagR molybdenum-binding subunit